MRVNASARLGVFGREAKIGSKGFPACLLLGKYRTSSHYFYSNQTVRGRNVSSLALADSAVL